MPPAAAEPVASRSGGLEDPGLKRFGTRGMTLIELVVVLTIFGVIFAITIPSYNDLVRKARAAQIVADLYAVRAAAFMYFAENNTWPRDYAPGRVPPELINYLPRGFTFRQKHYRLDWDDWRGPDGTSRFPSTGIVTGVTLLTADRKLAGAVQNLLKNLNFVEFTAHRYTMEVLGTAGVLAPGGRGIRPPEGPPSSGR